MNSLRCFIRYALGLVIGFFTAGAFAQTAPVIYNLPAGVTVNAGNSISIAPSVSGTQPMTFQWKKGGVNIGGATSSYFSKSNATATDSGQYTLTATNSVGSSTSAPVVVTVNPEFSPVILNMPAGLTVASGDSIYVNPTVTGTQPITFQWKKDGVILAGATAQTLSKSNATTADNGQYTLTATNAAGTTTSTPMTVTVNAAVTPSISNVYGGGTFNYGDAFNLSSSVSGTQPITFQWKKNGVSVVGANSAYFSKFNLTPADSGQYILTATNSAGTTTSAELSVLVRAATAPFFTSLPNPGTVAYGDFLSLGVSVGGTPPISYQWKKDGVVISGATSSYYSKSSVTDADGGQYTLTATNSLGTATTSAIFVTVGAATAPTITGVPFGFNIAFGQSISISPSVSGTQPITYQWKKDGVVLAGANSSAFYKNGATISDSGQYVLTATNATGSTSSTAVTISVGAVVAPTVVGMPANLAVNYGDAIYIGPSFRGSEPMTFQWQKDGAFLPGATSGSFSKYSATPADSGLYSVTVSNVGGTVTSSTVSVVVATPVAPSIGELPASLSVAYGDTLSINASVTGTQPMSYQWKKDGTVLSVQSSSYFSKSGVTSADAGSYTLTATNISGSSTSTTVVVTVAPAISPVISNLPGALTLGYGEDLALSPTVAGTVPMSFQWLKNGAIIPGANASSLSKQAITTADSGAYTLTATNLAGTTTSSSVSVNVNAALPPVIVNLPSALTLAYGDSLNLSPLVGGSRPMTLQWKKDGLIIPGANSASYSKNNVTPADAGAYSLSATNVVGTVTSATVVVAVNNPVAPAVFELPATVTVDYGSSLGLNPVVTGTGPLTFQWKKDGVAIAGATGQAYYNSYATVVNSGQYVLIATNLAGTATSLPVAVTVNPAIAPAVTSQPSSRNVIVGSPADFSVSVTGTSPFSYQWYFNNQAILAANSYSLTVPSVTTENAGGYKVTITNPGGSVTSSVATLTVNPLLGIVSVIGGFEHTLFIRSDGGLWGMGADSYGDLGDGGNSSRRIPTFIAADVAAAAAGGNHVLFIKTDGTLWAMGANFSGQLGDGTNTSRSTPVQVATAVVAVAAGEAHSLFITADGTLWAMGNNDAGQLGDGTSASRNIPTQIATNVIGIAAGTRHSMFIRSDETLWGMGLNGNGQLGDGSFIGRAAPVQVSTGGAVTKVSTGAYHTLFVQKDGSLWAMGFNANGQLGDGSTINRSTPVQIGSGVLDIFAGGAHSMFTKSDSTLWGVGYNGVGQLGNGSYDTSLNPVKLNTDVTTIGGGSSHSLVIKSDGSLWGAGSNSSGQLGNGSYQSAVFIPITNGPTTTPSAPVGVTASDSTISDGIRLAWKAANGTAWYEVWRSTTNDGSTAVRIAVKVPLALYFDPTAVPGVSYFYWVKAVNQAGASVLSASDAGVRASASLPSITTQPLSQAAFVGGSVTMTAVASGTPAPAVRWQKNGINVPGATNASLTLGNIQLSDAGSYALVATNAGGAVTSRFARVVVLVPQASATTYVTTAYPTGVTPGGTVGLDCLLTNVGTRNWGPNDYLSIRDSHDTFVAFSPLIGINSGENKRTHLSFPAPLIPGSYVYTIQGLESGVEFFSTQTTFTLNVLAQESNAITYNSTNFPISSTPGSNLIFDCNVTNTGTTNWGTGHTLTLRDSNGTSVATTPLNGVAPGQSKTVNLKLTAPSVPGVYTYHVRAAEAGVGLFTAQANLILTVLAPQPNAVIYTSTRSVDNVVPGALVKLRYSLSNAGTGTWGANHYASLRDGNGAYLAFAPVGGVAPSDTTTVSFNFVAPTTPGVYSYYVQNLEDGVEFFDSQDVVTLTVLSTPIANAATYNGSTFPAVVAPGAKVSFSENITNRGTKIWGPNHYLSLRDADNIFLGFLPLNPGVPGGSETLTFNFTAPTAPGVYTYHVQGFESGVEFFNMSDNLVLIVQ